MIYFASDIHLGGGDRESARQVERRFVAWLDAIANDAEAVFLLGDIFDFWFEYRRVVPKGFVRTLGRLAALTDRGVRVVFLSGNHDLWVRDYLTHECGVEVYTSPQVMTLSGRRIFMAHGDNMRIEGKLMLRLLNTIFRSRTLKWLFSWGLHPDLALKFGGWWSGKSRKSHDTAQDCTQANTEPLIAYARDYAAKHSIDDFIFGHMHFPRDYRDGELHVVNLGGWDNHPSCGVLDANGKLTLQLLDR